MNQSRAHHIAPCREQAGIGCFTGGDCASRDGSTNARRKRAEIDAAYVRHGETGPEHGPNLC